MISTTATMAKELKIELKIGTTENFDKPFSAFVFYGFLHAFVHLVSIFSFAHWSERGTLQCDDTKQLQI